MGSKHVLLGKETTNKVIGTWFSNPFWVILQRINVIYVMVGVIILALKTSQFMIYFIYDIFYLNIDSIAKQLTKYVYVANTYLDAVQKVYLDT